jgi:hypothetical protein
MDEAWGVPCPLETLFFVKSGVISIYPHDGVCMTLLPIDFEQQMLYFVELSV